MLDAGRSYVLFDGDCGICTSWSRWAERIDRRDLYAIVPYQSIPENALQARGVTYVDCERALQLIPAEGPVRRGALAINRFLFHYPPWSVLVALLYAIPVLLLGELVVYRLVARHRQTLSRRFGLQACNFTAAKAGDNGRLS